MTRYFRAKLSTWGFFHGLVAYLILAWLAPQWRGNLLALLGIGLLGSIMSTVIFAVLRPTRPSTLLLGFLFVSSLLPPFIVIGGDSLYYGRPYFAGPLTLGFIILWAILLLPFALIAQVIFGRISQF